MPPFDQPQTLHWEKGAEFIPDMKIRWWMDNIYTYIYIHMIIYGYDMCKMSFFHATSWHGENGSRGSEMWAIFDFFFRFNVIWLFIVGGIQFWPRATWGNHHWFSQQMCEFYDLASQTLTSPTGSKYWMGHTWVSCFNQTIKYETHFAICNPRNMWTKMTKGGFD